MNHIKPFLDQCISPSQFSFVPGQSIFDDITLVKEIAHSIANNCIKTKPMAIKVNLSKAYDSLEWPTISLDFLQTSAISL